MAYRYDISGGGAAAPSATPNARRPLKPLGSMNAGLGGVIRRAIGGDRDGRGGTLTDALPSWRTGKPPAPMSDPMPTVATPTGTLSAPRTPDPAQPPAAATATAAPAAAATTSVAPPAAMGTFDRQIAAARQSGAIKPGESPAEAGARRYLEASGKVPGEGETATQAVARIGEEARAARTAARPRTTTRAVAPPTTTGPPPAAPPPAAAPPPGQPANPYLTEKLQPGAGAGWADPGGEIPIEGGSIVMPEDGLTQAEIDVLSGIRAGTQIAPGNERIIEDLAARGVLRVGGGAPGMTGSATPGGGGAAANGGMGVTAQAPPPPGSGATEYLGAMQTAQGSLQGLSGVQKASESLQGLTGMQTAQGAQLQDGMRRITGDPRTTATGPGGSASAIYRTPPTQLQDTLRRAIGLPRTTSGMPVPGGPPPGGSAPGTGMESAIPEMAAMSSVNPLLARRLAAGNDPRAALLARLRGITVGV